MLRNKLIDIILINRVKFPAIKLILGISLLIPCFHLLLHIRGLLRTVRIGNKLMILMALAFIRILSKAERMIRRAFPTDNIRRVPLMTLRSI
jgi:hypothetical protein